METLERSIISEKKKHFQCSLVDFHSPFVLQILQILTSVHWRKIFSLNTAKQIRSHYIFKIISCIVIFIVELPTENCYGTLGSLVYYYYYCYYYIIIIIIIVLNFHRHAIKCWFIQSYKSVDTWLTFDQVTIE